MLIVLDTETTGLYPETGCVWEIAAVAVSGGRIIAEWQSRVRPDMERFGPSQRAVVRQVCGLSDGELLALLDARPVGVVSASFRIWQHQVRANEALLTSYNLAFDRAFLTAGGWSLGLHRGSRIEPIRWGSCLMLAAMDAMRPAGVLQLRHSGGHKWPSLSEACRHFGVVQREEHTALADAVSAAELAIAMRLPAAMEG